MSTHTLEVQASAVAAGAGSIAPVFGSPERRIEIHASKDGFPLAASLFQPRKFDNGIGVIISSAYATPRRHYATYAKYLTSLGFTVVTYDYRGVGGSGLHGWQGEPPLMRHWGERDLAGVIDWMGRHYPRLRLAHVGHSAGGQLPGLAGNNTELAALLAVASQTGYWRLREGRHRLMTWLYFHLMIPFMAYLTAWFPRLQRGAFAVPKGVALEFARWGRSPHYISDAQGRPEREGFARYRGQVRLYHIADDHDFAPRRAVEGLAAFYSNASTEIIHCEPANLGVDKIGHFGFFRAQMPRSAWFETALWLSSVAAPRRQRMEDSGQPERALCA